MQHRPPRHEGLKLAVSTAILIGLVGFLAQHFI